eukprot:gene11122-13144_t
MDVDYINKFCTKFSESFSGYADLLLNGLQNYQTCNDQQEAHVRDRLAAVLNGNVEIETPNGKIDVLTATEIIEVKLVTNWKHAFGQLCCYAVHYPDHQRRVHLFGSKEDNEKFKPAIQQTAKILGVHATFEDVSMQTTVPVIQTLPATAESTMSTLDCNSSTSQHTGGNDFVTEQPIDALLAHEKKLLDLETLRTARERQLTEQAALRAERGKYQQATEYAIQTNTALRCSKKCAIAKTNTRTIIDTTDTVANGNADATAVFDAANAPGDEIVTPNAARATVTTLLPSQFEPDATVNGNSVVNVVPRERSSTKVAADVDVDDGTDSDDDAIDSDDDELEYEFVPAINTTVCLNNKYTDVYAFCASNGKRWRKYLEQWISPAKHAEVALVYMRYSEGDVTLAKDILHRFDENNGTRTHSLVREGQDGADDEWVLHQADAELTRKRARDEDAERQRTLAKAQKLDDYELQEKECHLRRLQLELQQQEKEMEIRIAKLHQELETQKKTDAEELEIRKSRNAHDLRVHQFRDIKSAFESCLTIPNLGTEEANVYRAHIHNAVTEMSGNVSSVPAIAPSAAPINVTVNNNNNNSPTNNTDITTADQPCEMHNVQTVPTVTMDDANAAKNVIATPNAARAIETTLPPGQFECNGKTYEYQSELKTTICLSNKYADAHAFCKNNKKRWEIFLEDNQYMITYIQARLMMPDGWLIEQHHLGHGGPPTVFVHPALFLCLAQWISSAKHAEVALVYMRYSKADVALAKNVLNRLDEKNGTRTQFLVREGQADADDELMLHQADAEFTRKRARDEDAERQRTLAKARKLDDYELQEKEYHLRRLQLELQQQEKEMQIRIAKLHQELETQKKTDAEELEIRKSRNAQELETQKSRNAQELETQKSRNAQELEIQKSRNAHDLRVHQFRDIKSAFESCLTIPKLSTEEANVYRAHIHNMVANLVTNADASAAAPAIAAPPPVPPVNVTVNNITENNNTKTDEKKAADADGGGEVTLEEQLWREAWLKRGTPENPEVTIADFLADPSEPEHARYAEFMRSNPGFVETFRRRLAEAWRKRHGTWNIPTQAGTA